MHHDKYYTSADSHHGKKKNDEERRKKRMQIDLWARKVRKRQKRIERQTNGGRVNERLTEIEHTHTYTYKHIHTCEKKTTNS